MKKLVLLAALVTFTCVTALAQNYSFIKSTGTYSNLPAPTILSIAGWDDDVHSVPIGFAFNLGSNTYTSLEVDENGMVYFDANNDIFLVACIADLFESPVLTANSNISYQLTGTAGSQILKLQWQNAGFYDGDATDFTNFQVWLHEGSNKIETHFGPVSIVDPSLVFDPGPIYGIILNLSMAGSFSGPFLSGDPLNPVFQNVVNGTFPPMLLSHPVNSVIYTFSPLITGLGKPIANLELAVYPNPATDVVALKGIGDKLPVTVKIYDMLGKLVTEKQFAPAQRLQLNVAALKPGTYLIEAITPESHFTRKVIKL